jgi:type III secretion system YscD/HrpQ family protein
VNALLSSEAEALEQDNPLELRILHGAQAGSRLILASGEYLIGSGDSCTLMLAGPMVADEHAILKFDGKAARIDPLDGIVRNAHGDEITEEAEMAYGLPVELGSVWISVDREDAPWPDPQSVMPIPPAQATEADDEIAAGSPSVTSSAQPNAQSAMSGASSAAPEKKRRRGTVVMLLLLPAVAGLAGYAIATVLHQEKPAVAQAASPPLKAGDAAGPPPAAVAVLKDYPSEAGLMLQKENDGWIVTGFLPTAAQQQNLVSMLASAAPGVQVKVTLEDALLEEARNLLASQPRTEGRSVKVTSAAGGVLRLTGATSSAEDVEQIKQVLLDGLAGARSVESGILLPDQLRKQLKDRIVAAGLAERMSYTAQEPEVRLTGRLTSEEIRRWEELMVRFNADYGNALPIRATVTRVVPKPPVGVQAIVGGPVPYIVTERGEHVNQGGDVNGHTLVSVRDGEVVFEGSQRIRIAR